MSRVFGILPASAYTTSRIRLCFHRLIIYAALLFALPGCSVFAQPSNSPAVSAVFSPSTPDEVWRVQGERFSNSEHEFVMSDTGDQVRLMQDNKIKSVLPEKLWSKRGSAWAEPLERRRDKARSQTYYQAKGKSYNGYLKPLENAGSTQLFVSWRLKLSESPGHAKGSNKFIRIWDQTDGKGTRISWTQMHMTYNGSKKPSWGGWPGKGNKWNQMSLWVDGEQGEIEARVNDKLAHDISDFKKADTDKGLNIKLIGFDPNRSTPYENMEVGIDDLYVSSTPARVVVSDEPNWVEAQSRQSMQVPTRWQDDEIRFIYQPAKYLNSERYLYVVDKHGAANAKGFPLARATKLPEKTRTEPNAEAGTQR